jgi:hypothetical protein
VRFDADRRKVIGEPVELVADRVGEATRVTVSDNGTMAYLAEAAPDAKLEVIDALGNVISALPDIRPYAEPIVSPDGKHFAVAIAVGSEVEGKFDLWVYDVASRVFMRLVQARSPYAAWTPDSKRIGFVSSDDQFSWMPADGSAAAQPIPGTAALRSHGYFRMEFSADNKYAVMLRAAVPGQPIAVSHVTAVPLAGGEPISVLDRAEAPQWFDVSRDSKWVAFESREDAGIHQVFIHSFPDGNTRLQVSTHGGDEPHWSADGRRLLYRRDKLMLEATLDFSGPVPRVLRTDTLFASQNPGARPIDSYGVHPDGKHFVVTRLVGDATKLVVVTNWLTDVRAKLARK